jgi:intraflagellar transport protein 80
MEIIKFELNQVATSYDRKVAIIDSNKDCWMTQLHKNEWVKVNSMVDSLLWNESLDILSLVADNTFITYS